MTESVACGIRHLHPLLERTNPSDLCVFRSCHGSIDLLPVASQCNKSIEEVITTTHLAAIELVNNCTRSLPARVPRPLGSKRGCPRAREARRQKVALECTRHCSTFAHLSFGFAMIPDEEMVLQQGLVSKPYAPSVAPQAHVNGCRSRTGTGCRCLAVADGSLLPLDQIHEHLSP